ncbi:predicted protein [Pyrenophora tritici-repentis Pt-1C-BFP]|uniref:Uncharacterized protein n=1 Tax=Pyrenophora tritici-repentis (strain Pt-1C-BFP) TaxID=426418 RepID=B2W4Y8_PYRTR|nr:uncharacterized protein PTRG_04688 [Pyrenophora tritici-repentis Pt-1C-BFP]EDU47595.1 predicted protein [Pyrenophora tritici-repentis Pt-1C-BFP]
MSLGCLRAYLHTLNTNQASSPLKTKKALSDDPNYPRNHHHHSTRLPTALTPTDVAL